MNKSEADKILKIFMLLIDKQIRPYIWFERRFNRNFPTEFAEAIGVPNLSRSVYANVNKLEAHIHKLREGLEPEQEDEPEFECVGCGALADAKGLRWKKLGEGKAVTVSIDHSGKPAALSWLTDDEIMKHWFKPWTVGNSNIKFELVKSGKGDSHITFQPVDGPGKTLKFVWQPANGADFMEQGGDLSGDMVCDSSERTYPRSLVKEAGKHEVGHVLGIGHLSSRSDVMYPTASGRTKPLSKNDKQERDERYPIGKAA